MVKHRPDMVITRKMVSIYLFLLVASSVSCCMGKLEKGPPLECELYIAESTIPNSGLGIFTTVKKKVGDTVGNGDVCFPLLQLDWHNGVVLTAIGDDDEDDDDEEDDDHSLEEDDEDEDDDEDDYYDPFSDFVWDGNTMGMGAECDNSDITALWPGLDSAMNFHIPLENVKRSFPSHLSHGDKGLDYIPHRSKDPGAGSITTYRSSHTLVLRDIPAGGELFKFYGEDWFLSREFAGLPLQRKFPTVQDLLENYDQMQAEPLYQLMLAVQTTWEKSRTLNALPQEGKESALLEKNINMYQDKATRSLEWLQEHGKCADHIVHRVSTIPGAGEGAFAKRRLPKGTLITGSPVMHIPDPTLLDMYNFTYDKKMDAWIQRDLNTTQVILNYCLGHRDSKLLLFPYGSGVNYINHGSGKKANVRMQWAEHGTTNHDNSWLKRPLEEDYGVHLAIDYIAIRDIEEGEELFMDYGSEWEEAWYDHLASWKPPEEITTAADWNLQFKDAPLRTWSEVVEKPYPATVQVRCHVNLLDRKWDKKLQRWDRYVPHTEEYQTVYGLPCEVVARSADNSSYTVILKTDHLVLIGDFADDFSEVRKGVPREAIFFIDAPYTSDLYLENAFRHPIAIPDNMMPGAWKDKASSQE